MRIGNNPEKESPTMVVENYHRIIVPVFIPHFEGYFKEAFDVFKLCIESLLLTVHSKTRITIYNNNSHESVKKYIDEKYATETAIDQVFHSKENLGKINAILSAAKGNLEPLVTITDADVLFKHNWQTAVEAIFCGFPEAGMVSPVPSSIASRNYTANNWAYGIFKGKLFFDDVVDPLGLTRFDDSLGNKVKFYNDIHLSKYLILKSRKTNAEAVMGCGHFVATLRREVFDKGTNEPAFFKIQNGVESKFIDIPNEELGFLRLATKDNYAYHMGNTTENWMRDEFFSLQSVGPNSYIDSNKVYNGKKMSPIMKRIGKIIIRFTNKKKIRKFVFHKLGLNYQGVY